MRGGADIFVVSAPSGAGKTTLISRLFRELDGLAFSVSFTTRPPREGEADGRDYNFIDRATFDQMIAGGGFIEWVEVYGNRYGTGRAWVENRLAVGLDVVLDLETVGAARVKAMFPGAILIFLMPPSARALEQRLKGRASETAEQISLRMARAKHEMERWENYDHIIINDAVEPAYGTFKAIFLAARAAGGRMAGAAGEALASFG